MSKSAAAWFRERAAGLLAIGGFLAFALFGTAIVPFHPDETSLLYQSRDLEQLLSDPGAMVWRPGTELDREATYRALNPPLPKYLLGIGRRLAGYSAAAVSVDWDWSADWAANVQRGALPPDGLLNGARAASTLLLPLALLAVYRVGEQLDGRSVGWLTAGLLGSNALFLLHGRRAMMEGTLFLALGLGLWAILRADRRPWLAGLSLGLALAAKHSLLPLLPVAMLAALWSNPVGSGWRRRLLRLVLLLVAAAVATLALNPFLWASPIAGASRIWEERGSLVGDQLRAQNLAEHVAMELPMSTSDRLAAFLGQLYFAPPQFEEAGNYRAELSNQVAGYLRLPPHGWMRGWLVGGLMFGLTLVGMSASATSLIRQRGEARRKSALLLLSTLVMGGALMIAVPFPFQRYYLPMLPLVSLWSALAVIQLFRLSKRLLSERAAVA